MCYRIAVTNDTTTTVGGEPLPSPGELATLRREAARLATEAGELLLRYFSGPLDIRFKGEGDRDPVTEADGEAERLLRDGILGRFPNHAILGEETDEIAGDPGSPYLWVLDPLDGTTNFMNGLALWGVSVGVLHQLRPIAGAIWTPGGVATAPAVLHAAAGLGASCGDAAIDRSLREAVKARIGTVPGGGGGSHRPLPEGVRLGDRRVLGSIAIEAAMVAMGVLQYGVFARPRLWDIAAGAIIVREAGGAVLMRGAGGWGDTDRFELPADGDGSLASLRNWTAPIICGDAAIVGHLAGRMSPPRRSVLGRVFGKR